MDIIFLILLAVFAIKKIIYKHVMNFNCKYQKSTANVHVVTNYIKPYEIKYKRIVCRKLICEIISSTVRVVLFSLKHINNDLAYVIHAVKPPGALYFSFDTRFFPSPNEVAGRNCFHRRLSVHSGGLRGRRGVGRGVGR